jgi:hypothetical protein
LPAGSRSPSLDDAKRDELVENIVGHASAEVNV